MDEGFGGYLTPTPVIESLEDIRKKRKAKLLQKINKRRAKIEGFQSEILVMEEELLTLM